MPFAADSDAGMRDSASAIPATTRQVLAASTYRVEPEPYLWVQVSTVRTPERHLLVCRDEREITVVTTAAGLEDLAVVAVNADRWVLFTIDCANPFYCVGFLAAIGNELVARGVDVLMASTFSRDLVFVETGAVALAR